MEAMEAYDFLKSKIGEFNSNHPFMEKDVDYEDVINWLNEYAELRQSLVLGCVCTPEKKHGETSIMCCNHCGKPTEEFWCKH